MSAADFEATKQRVASSRWSDLRAVLRAADQLCTESRLDDAPWAALTEPERTQMRDLRVTIATYAMQMVFNITGIERQPALVAAAAEYGAPTTAAA